MRARSKISVKPWPFWKPLDAAELAALEWVARVRFGGSIEQATRVVTRAGEHGLVWYVLAGVGAAFDRQHRQRWIESGATVAASYAANTALKFVARRGRPPIAEIGTETDLSFPSSHAVTSFAAARTMSQLLPGPLGRAAAYGAAFSVMGSRLHFCVHYPTDLLAGSLLGDAAGRVTTRRWARVDVPTRWTP